MITIKNIWIARGYTGNDHLIDGRALKNLIGEQFRSVREARKKADAIMARTEDRRVQIAPIEMEVMFANGSTTEV